MKLKTFRPDDKSLPAMAVGNRKADLCHDAAYAHALVMAMQELEAHHRGWHQILRSRAAEILREWGYTDD